MNTKLAQTVVKFMATKDGAALLNAIGKNPSTDLDILRSLGVKNPSASDVNDVKELFSAYKSSTGDMAGETVSKIREIMRVNPKVAAIIAGVRAVSAGARAVGNVAKTHGNRLAEAIMAANRVSSDEQISKYGASPAERFAQAYGTDLIRRGENIGHVTDAVSNVIDKTIGDYNSQEAAVRSMSATPYLQGTPGALYHLINGMQRRGMNP